MEHLAKVLLPENADVKLVAKLCLLVSQQCKAQNKSVQMATLRSFVRLLHSTYLLYIQYSTSLPSALWAAYNTTFASQFKETDIWGEDMSAKVKVLLSGTGEALLIPDYTSAIKESQEHVLTPSRKLQAEAVLACVACNMPVLLEGPAAVGKTSLVSYLAKNQKNPKKLERVNNTDTTSIQDYLGSYLPMGNIFVFQEGALYRAMKNGWWFLSDEFNLAEPAVLNLLFPLLEGKGLIQIPGTDKTVHAHPDFRFFATQNDAKYASRHQLPTSLRNRFLEVQVNDFPIKELPSIIEHRQEPGQPWVASVPGDKLALIYHALKDTPYRITMREIIKWVRRQALLPHLSWPLSGMSLLCNRYLSDSDGMRTLLSQFEKIWGPTPRGSEVVVEQKDSAVIFREGTTSVTLPGYQLSNSYLWGGGRSPPDSLLRVLVKIAFASFRYYFRVYTIVRH